MSEYYALPSDDRVNHIDFRSVHGEFRFSPLPMPPPRDWRSTGGRLSGEDMQYYMESFEEHFLNGKVRYNTEVLKIQRTFEKPSKSSLTPKPQWSISVLDKKTGASSQLKYDKVVLCSGVRLLIRVLGT